MVKIIISAFFMLAIFIALILIGKEGQKVRTYEFEEKIVFAKTLRKIFCNGCGLEIDLENSEWIDKYHHFEVGYGYGSDHDGDTYNFDLCEKCLDNLYKTMKIKPEIKSWMEPNKNNE